MRAPSTTSKRGILNPAAAERHFRLARYEAAIELDAFVERHWTVSWDLRGREPFTQEILPHPSVNLAFQRGACGVFGIVTKRSFHRLEGQGKVFGTKFRPAAFYPFAKFDVTELTDRILPIERFFDVSKAFIEEVLDAEEDDLAQRALVERMLLDHLPDPDENVALVGRVCRLVLDDREVQRVEDVCDRLDVSVRTLQRLFRRYVGVSPKWVIQRVRLHEAAERIAEGRTDNWAATAIDLGYFDQAHFIKDFKGLVGKSPAEYAAACAAFRSAMGKPTTSSASSAASASSVARPKRADVNSTRGA